MITMVKNQKPPTENYCICTWRALKKILCLDPWILDLKKRNFVAESKGVLVKFTINKSEEGEKAMREFAELGRYVPHVPYYEKKDEIPYERIRSMKRIKILSEVVGSEYVNNMGNL